MLSKNTQHTLDVTKGILSRKWSAQVKVIEDRSVTISVQTAPEAIVGKWLLHIDTKVKDEVTEVMRYTHQYPVYLLFNPWCKGTEYRLK